MQYNAILTFNSVENCEKYSTTGKPHFNGSMQDCKTALLMHRGYRRLALIRRFDLYSLAFTSSASKNILCIRWNQSCLQWLYRDTCSSIGRRGQSSNIGKGCWGATSPDIKLYFRSGLTDSLMIQSYKVEPTSSFTAGKLARFQALCIEWFVSFQVIWWRARPSYTPALGPRSGWKWRAAWWGDTASCMNGTATAW